MRKEREENGRRKRNRVNFRMLHFNDQTDLSKKEDE